jgi:hypothetical protein
MDCGRWSPCDRSAGETAFADLVVLVVRPTLDSIEHARAIVEPLIRVNPAVAVLVSGGSEPYGPDEIADALGRPLVGVIPWDPNGVLAFLGGGPRRAWLRSPLRAAAARAADELHRLTELEWLDV